MSERNGKIYWQEHIGTIVYDEYITELLSWHFIKASVMHTSGLNN